MASQALTKEEVGAMEELALDKQRLVSQNYEREIERSAHALYHIFGLDVKQRKNLVVVDEATVMLVLGGALIVFNLETRQKRLIYSLDGGGIGCVALHPSKQVVAVGEKGNWPNVYLYSYPGFKVLNVLRKGTECGYSDLSFNSEGDTLATVGQFPDFMLTVWDWRQERILLHSKAFGQEVFNVEFSLDDGGRLTTSGTGHIRFWKMASTFTGLKLQGAIGKFGKVELTDVLSFVELPDGKVLSGTETGSLLLWEGNFIKCRFVLPDGGLCHEGEITTMLHFRNERVIVTAGRDGVIKWWDYETIDTAEVDADQTLDYVLSPLREFVVGMSAPDDLAGDDAAAAAKPANIAWIARLPNKSESGSGSSGGSSSDDAAAETDAADAEEGEASVATDEGEGVEKKEEKSAGGTNTGSSLANVGEGSVFIVLDQQGKMWRCDVDAGTSTSIVDFHGGSVTGVDTAPSEHVAASCGADGSVRCYDYINRRELFRSVFAQPASFLRWAPLSADADGRTVVVGFDDGVVRVLWRSADEFRRVAVFKPHSGAVTCLAFNPVGNVLVTGGADGNMFFFAVEGAAAYRPLGFVHCADNVAVRGLEFGGGGIDTDVLKQTKLLVSCGDDTIREYDLTDVDLLGMGNGESFDVTDQIPLQSCAFAPKRQKKRAANEGANGDGAEGGGDGDNNDSGEETKGEAPTGDGGEAGGLGATAGAENTASAETLFAEEEQFASSSVLQAVYIPEDPRKSFWVTASGSERVEARLHVYRLGEETAADDFPLYPPRTEAGYTTAGRTHDITYFTRSRSGAFLLAGCTDGSVTVHPVQRPEVFCRVLMHNCDHGGIASVSLSHDDKYLVVGSHDGTVSVHLLRASKVVDDSTAAWVIAQRKQVEREEAASTAAAAAREGGGAAAKGGAPGTPGKDGAAEAKADATTTAAAEADGSETDKSAAVRPEPVYPREFGAEFPEYCFGVELEWEGEAPIPEGFEGSVPAADVADEAAASGAKAKATEMESAPDITDPSTYSIQEAKLKTEEDNRRTDAEGRKEAVRDHIRALRREYESLLEENSLAPEEVRLRGDDLLVDPEFQTILASEGQAAIEETEKACAYDSEKSQLLLRKLRERFLDEVPVENIPLSSLRSGYTVNSLRTRLLDSSLMELLDSVHALMRKEEMLSAMHRQSSRFGHGGGEPGAEDHSIGSSTAAAAAAAAAGGAGAAAVDGGPGRFSMTAGLVSPGEGEAAEGEEKKDGEENATSFEMRKAKRLQRREGMKQHLDLRPKEDADDPRDLHAIDKAKRLLGDYKLKCSDEYEVPEEQRVNAEKKRRQMVLLEEGVLKLKLQFNERFLALRELKREIIQTVRADNQRVAQITDQLGDHGVLELWEPVLDAKEWPDDRFEVTESDVDAFRQARDEKGGVIAAASDVQDNSVITGTKTRIVQDGTTGGLRPVRVHGTLAPHESAPTDSSGDGAVEGARDGNASSMPDHSGTSYGVASNLLGLPQGDALTPQLPILLYGAQSFMAPASRLAEAAPEGQARPPSGGGDGDVKDDATADTGVITVESNATTAGGGLRMQLGEEWERRLRFERDALIRKTQDNVSAFDEAVLELHKDRLMLTADLKVAQLRLIILLQELMLLRTFEGRDAQLAQRQTKCQREKSEINANMRECMAKLQERKDEILRWEDRSQDLMKEFLELVPETHQFYDALLKVYKRKIKRTRKRLDDEDSDEEEDESDWDDEDSDEDEDEEDVDDSCPVGCDSTTYDQVLELRERRLDLEEVLADFQKALDELNRNHSRLAQREKQVDKELKGTELEIQSFQREKQRGLNQLEVFAPLKISQLYCFDESGEKTAAAILREKEERLATLAAATTTAADAGKINAAATGADGTAAGEEAGGGLRSADVAGKGGAGGAGGGAGTGDGGAPGTAGAAAMLRDAHLTANMDLRSHVVFQQSAMAKLRSRIDELYNEIEDAKESFRGLRRDRTRLDKETQQLRQEIDGLSGKCTDLQMLKFGREIDMEVLDHATVATADGDYNAKIERLEKEKNAELRGLDKTIRQLKMQLMHTTNDNTAALQQMHGLSSKQFTIEKELNRQTGVSGADNGPAIRREIEERNRLVTLVKLQTRELGSLQAEINLLRRKAGPVYVPALANSGALNGPAGPRRHVPGKMRGGLPNMSATAPAGMLPNGVGNAPAPDAAARQDDGVLPPDALGATAPVHAGHASPTSVDSWAAGGGDGDGAGVGDADGAQPVDGM